MEPQEKKYRVDSFTHVQQVLTQKGATAGREVVAIHYYGEHGGKDVEKLVECADRYEIHVLKESGGRFTMLEQRQVADKNAGLAWLKSRGHTKANIVKMAFTEYAYKVGRVGLYVIDDFLHSVILYYLPGEHEAMEKEFGLENAEVMTVPYNKYLEKLGRLRSMGLN